MKGYKGFDKDLKCRGMQYEVGKEYEHEGEVRLCESGFHFCENPHDIFRHYPPGEGNRFAIVEADGVSSKSDGDSKRAAKKLEIKSEISVFEICKIAVEVFFENFGFNKKIESVDAKKAGDRGAAMTGDFGAARAGDRGAAMTGDFGAARAGNCGAAMTGDFGAARAEDRGAAMTGDFGAARAGYGGAAMTGDFGAARAGDRGAARAGSGGVAMAGNCGAARAGYGGAAWAGAYGVARAGENGMAEVESFGVAVVDNSGRVKGKKGSVLVAREFKINAMTNEYEVTDWACALVDGETIKEDTWYVLKDGKLVEEDKEKIQETKK